MLFFSNAEDEPFYGGASEMAYQKFVMGFGAVPVPEGCEVAEVKAALQAKDYYQVGFKSFSWFFWLSGIVMDVCC
jgi:hypothetical protein